jgi:hypothetical protein
VEDKSCIIRPLDPRIEPITRIEVPRDAGLPAPLVRRRHDRLLEYNLPPKGRGEAMPRQIDGLTHMLQLFQSLVLQSSVKRRSATT